MRTLLRTYSRKTFMHKIEITLSGWKSDINHTQFRIVRENLIMQENIRVTTRRNIIMSLEVIKLFVNLTIKNKSKYSKCT